MINGVGTPFLNIYDRAGNILLDVVLVDDGTYRPLAIDNFTYTFCETEDDTGSITLVSNSPEFMDKLNLYYKQTIYLEWGWLGGTRRPRLPVVVRNLKESFSSDGFKMTLEISDRLAVTKTAHGSELAKLNELRDHLTGATGAQEDDRLKEFDDFLIQSKLPQINPADLEKANNEAVNPIDTPNTGHHIYETEIKLPINNEEIKNKKLTSEELSSRGFEVWNGGAKDNVFGNSINLGDDFWEKYFPGGVPGPLPEGVDEDGNPILAYGTNTAATLQNYMNKTSDEPVSVTGEGNDLKIFKRKRAAMAPPKDKYVFRGDDGRFLEFNYDSDSTYANDTNVLRTLKVDPETGNITTTEFTEDTRKIIDVYNSAQEGRALWDAAAQQTLINRILNNPDTPADQIEVLKSIPSAKFYPGFQRIDGVYEQSVDNTSMVTSYIAVGVTAREDAISVVEKEISNLKMGDAMRNKATAVFYGDPNLSNGYNVMLSGLSKKRNGTYHITNCTHSFSSKRGYEVICELYKVSDIPVGINVITNTKTHGEVAKRAQEIQEKYNLEEFQKIQERYGYIPIEMVATNSWYPSSPSKKGTKSYYEGLAKRDANYVTKLGYTIYTVKIKTDKGDKIYKIRIPNNPSTGKSENFGDIFDVWDLYHTGDKVMPEIEIISTTYVKPNLRGK